MNVDLEVSFYMNKLYMQTAIFYF